MCWNKDQLYTSYSFISSEKLDQMYGGFDVSHNPAPQATTNPLNWVLHWRVEQVEIKFSMDACPCPVSHVEAITPVATSLAMVRSASPAPGQEHRCLIVFFGGGLQTWSWRGNHKLRIKFRPVRWGQQNWISKRRNCIKSLVPCVSHFSTQSSDPQDIVAWSP